MSVSILKSNLHGLADLIGFGLPSSKTNAGHLIARVERVDGPDSESAAWKYTLLQMH